jgi:hypothetical protein
MTSTSTFRSDTNQSSIKYLITDSQITFFKENQVKSVYKESGLNELVFNVLKDCLQSGNLIEIDDSKEYYLEQLRQKPGLIKSVQKRVEELTTANLPTEPFFKFLNKCPDHLLSEIEVLTKAGTVDMPLTWEGDVVLYQRASYMRNNNTYSDWAGESSFRMGNVLEGEQLVSSFDYIVSKTCCDAGPVFEVVVQPQHITSVNSNSSSFWTVNRLTQMTRLGIKPFRSSQADTGIVEFITNCVGSDKQAIRLPYNAGTASKMVNALFTHSVNNIVPVKAVLNYC